MTARLPMRASISGLYPDIDFDQLAAATGNRLGRFDLPCPLCGPDRKSAVNRQRPVLRVWRETPHFITYNCARCDLRGSVGASRPAKMCARPIPVSSPTRADDEARRIRAARALWTKSLPIEGTLAAAYLASRGITGELPGTLRFLPAWQDHPPAMIGAFGQADEVECGRYEIATDNVMAVQLTRIRSDGTGKAGTQLDKFSKGLCKGAPMMLVPPNDGQAMSVAEGSEDALSMHKANGYGAWATGGADLMGAAAAAVPSFVECVVIVADANKAGQKGTAALAAALASHGCEVLATRPLRLQEGAV